MSKGSSRYIKLLSTIKVMLTACAPRRGRSCRANQRNCVLGFVAKETPEIFDELLNKYWRQLFGVSATTQPFRAYSKGEESAARGVHQTSLALFSNSAQLFSRRQFCEIAVESYFNDRQPEVDEL